MQKPFYFLMSLLAINVFVLCGHADTARAEGIGTETPEKEDSTIKPTGLIAYIRNDAEIRLIDSTGNNDRQLWTHPDAKAPFGIFDLAWRPDGRELAFSSGHQNMVSLYHADLYGIRPDGSGFRKITNTPDYKNLGNYKKGVVTITLRNNQYTFQRAESSTGIFTVYVMGAQMPQQVLLPPGTIKTITFENVADFGDHAQPVVAIYGQTRWIMPGTNVAAGKTTKASDFIISGDGYPYFGAFRPVWKNDGTQISYRDGMCLIKTVAVNAGVGVQFKPLFGGQNRSASCVWDLGPTAALSNQVLYLVDSTEETSGFYMKPAGENNQQSVPLYLTPYGAYDLKWLADGSGFLYSKKYYRESDSKLVSNIFRYDIATKNHVQVTDLQDGYARQFSVSPSGKWIVYEKCTIDEEKSESLDFKCADIWIISVDGQQDRLLVKNGLCPTWSK